MELKKSRAMVLVLPVLTAGLVWLVACKTEPNMGPGSGDEPVVMAGGSMRFVTAVHRFDVNPQNHKLSHSQKTKKMTQVEILYSDNNGPAFATVALNNSKNTIDIDYCNSFQGGTCTGKNTIAVESSNDGTGMDLTPPQVAPNQASNVVEYQPVTGSISQIRINSATYNCPSQGSGYCFLVIHYK